jgi:hypothetical protein
MNRLLIALAAASIAVCAMLSLRCIAARADESEFDGLDKQVNIANGDVWFAHDWRSGVGGQYSTRIFRVVYDKAATQEGAAMFDAEVGPLPAIEDSGTVNLAAGVEDGADRAVTNMTSAADQDNAGDQDNTVANLEVNPAPSGATDAADCARFRDHPIVYNLLADERNFYRCASLEWLAAGLGTSAILANTHADQGFRDSYGETFRPADRNLDFLKQFGNGVYVIPALAAIWVADFGIDSYTEDERWGACEWLQEWSGRSIRGLIVGAAPVLSLQYLIGSSRPGAGSTSRWEPFQSKHGVSGHSFVGAVPFWTAAQMTDSWMMDAGFFTMGTMAGWSRIHTDAHYLSQVLLGWWLAGLSVSAVNHTELITRQWWIMPAMDEGGGGIYLVHLR